MAWLGAVAADSISAENFFNLSLSPTDPQCVVIPLDSDSQHILTKLLRVYQTKAVDLNLKDATSQFNLAVRCLQIEQNR
jgi:hypothetical protein